MKYTHLIRSLPAKIVLYTLAFLLVLAAFVGLVLPSVITWQAPQQIQERSGHVLDLGKPRINPFLLEVSIPQTSLSKPSGEQLLSFNELALDVSFKRLFKGEIEVTEFRADSLNLNLALEEGNRLNWQDLIDALAPPPSEKPEPEEPAGRPVAFELVKFALTDGQLQFEDRRTPDGYATTLSPINLELENLSTTGSQEGEFELNAETLAGAKMVLAGQIDAVTPALAGRFSLDNFELASLAAALKPILPVQPPTGNLGLAAQFDVKVPQDGLQLTVSEGTLSLKQFAVSGKGKNPTQLALQSLNATDAKWEHGVKTLTLAGLTLTGLSFSDTPEGKPRKLAGFQSLEVKQTQVELQNQKATIAEVALASPSAQAERLANGDLTLLNAVNRLLPADNTAQEKPETKATKQTAASQPRANSEPPVPAQAPKPWTWTVGKIALNGGSVDYTDRTFSPALNYGARNINVSTANVTDNLEKPLPVKANLSVQGGGQLEVQADVTPATGQVQAKITLQDLAVAHAQPFLNPVVRLEVAQGAIDSNGELKVKGSQVDFAGDVQVRSLRLNHAGTRNAFITFDALKLNRINAGTQAASVERVLLSGLDTRLAIAEDKSTNIDSILIQSEQTDDAQAQANGQSNAKPAGPAFAVRVNRFSVANSKLDFEDKSLIIPFGTRIQKLQGVITGISNQPGAVGEVELSGQVDEFGLASAQGQLAFTDPTQLLDLDVMFKNLAMNNLTPYTANFAGRKIESGKLNLDLSYKITDQALESTNRVVVEQLKLGERVESPDAVDLPLDLAVAILEDSNGVIDLGLPVSGSLNDPQFSLGSIVFKALQNVLTNIVTAPFRALGSLFGGDQDLGTVTFTAGKNTLNPPERESVIRLAQALKKRPNLKLEIQGTWAEKDQVALQRQALRMKVTSALGVKLEAGESPGPIALDDPATQEVLEQLYEEQFGTGELLSLKDGYKQVNPDQLNEGLGSALAGGVAGVFADKRELSQAELNALKGQNFFEVLRRQLQNAQVVEQSDLIELAEQRVKQVMATLQQADIPADRLSSKAPAQTEPQQEKGIALNLGLAS